MLLQRSKVRLGHRKAISRQLGFNTGFNFNLKFRYTQYDELMNVKY